ncbi:hypothetical protein DICSQDRAFT_101821 [Dichomitus squalens LYAD-421 SS1]|uniref:uncharacterized protein n=1 Tax=Dichomitus squalens (strain LYAD-421) TaxID=732165 RepID=UPI0004413BE9|nr:uncharacterized protein DICSQDRAFT_101821 [Dichomitus squalens LYAD-421 SS1]EJF63788.1 hypothetical protein DICSQDRAFT_101821 [Dichomitus squalens LYAD-421 SS1]
MGGIPPTPHLGLLAYATVLFLLATVGYCLQTWLNHRAFIIHRNADGGPYTYILSTSRDAPSLATVAIYVVLNWCADGMLLYRFCCIFSSSIWANLMSAAMLVSLIVVGSLCVPNISQLVDNLWTNTTTIPSLAYLTLSLSINVVLSVAIIVRLCLYRRQTFSSRVAHMYDSVVTMIIESALPYGIVALLTIVACGTSTPMQNALLPMLGQLQAIPPLVIMIRVKDYRISRDLAFTSTTIQFASPTATYERPSLDDKGSLPPYPRSCLVSSRSSVTSQKRPWDLTSESSSHRLSDFQPDFPRPVCPSCGLDMAIGEDKR